MERQEILNILDSQRKFFSNGNTLSVKTRKNYLIKLKQAIVSNEEKLCLALKADLGKSREESYMCEVGLTLSELSYQIKHIKKFTKPQRVKTPLSQAVSKSFRYPSPYGVVLVMSPWNYPFLLTIEPLVEAVAAGNTVVIKPSAYSPNTSNAMMEVLSQVFPKEYVAVITGGREENKALLEQKFDYIFFTGSKAVGQEVMRSASSFMTPVTLELGGKSPLIVDESAKISLAAKRICWGKYLNCGQTCVAPDYVLCHESVKDSLIAALKKEIVSQFGENPLQNQNYGKIISQKHFDRIVSLIDQSKVVHGGKFDSNTLKIQPTILDNVTYLDACMGEEIFGPVLPILTYQSLDQVIDTINSKDSPLALYIFSTNKKNIDKVLSRVSFGGGCINDTVIHLATSSLPFGGVGASGMGSYHGKQGFDTFTHYKSIIDKKNFLDLPMRYQPFKKLNTKLVRMFLK